MYSNSQNQKAILLPSKGATHARTKDSLKIFLPPMHSRSENQSQNRKLNENKHTYTYLQQTIIKICETDFNLIPPRCPEAVVEVGMEESGSVSSENGGQSCTFYQLKTTISKHRFLFAIHCVTLQQHQHTSFPSYLVSQLKPWTRGFQTKIGTPEELSPSKTRFSLDYIQQWAFLRFIKRESNPSSC